MHKILHRRPDFLSCSLSIKYFWRPCLSAIILLGKNYILFLICIIECKRESLHVHLCFCMAKQYIYNLPFRRFKFLCAFNRIISVLITSFFLTRCNNYLKCGFRLCNLFFIFRLCFLNTLQNGFITYRHNILFLQYLYDFFRSFLWRKINHGNQFSLFIFVYNLSRYIIFGNTVYMLKSFFIYIKHQIIVKYHYIFILMYSVVERCIRQIRGAKYQTVLATF